MLRLLAIGTVIKYIQGQLPLHFVILGSVPDLLFAASAVVVTILEATNPLGQDFFIVWHIVRVEDRWTHWFAQGVDDVWVREGWHQKFGLPERDTGIGYTAEQVGEFPALGGEDLKSYFEDVRVDTLGFLRDLSSADLELVPGRAPFRDHPGPVASFGTPFSIGRMYRQLIGEHNQHLGQVALLRGMQRGMDG